MSFFNKKNKLPVEKVEREHSSFILGVQDTFVVKDSLNLIAVGKLEGTVNVGDAVYISNPGSDENKILLATIDGIETGPNNSVSTATDCHVALLISNGRQHFIRKSTVLFTRDRSIEDVHTAYINALGDTFVIKQKLELSDNELNDLTVTDCSEIWRLFSWFNTNIVKDENDSTKKENYKKIDKVANILCEKLMQADSIYCVFNKATGEPHMFSRTIDQGDGTYTCVPPNIRIFTKAYKDIMKDAFPDDIFEIKLIENGKEKNGIYNFFGSTFYLNGACGVEFLSEETAISSDMLVSKPDYSTFKKQDIPVTNPSLVRWMLLIGQLGKPQDEAAELIYKLYYLFLSKEIVNATFLIPMKKSSDIPATDKNGMTTLKEDLTIKFPTTDGKHDRSALCLFTDWKRLRMVYDETWDGMVQSLDEFIEIFDCNINPTQYPQAGCYLDKKMFDDMKQYK